MKLKKKKLLIWLRLKRRLTTFASSPKFTKGVKLWTRVTHRPLSAYPKTENEREALRHELHVQFDVCIRKFLAAEKASKEYGRIHTQTPNPGLTRLVAIECDKELDVIQFWSLLERLDLIPIDEVGAAAWKDWRSYVASVRRSDAFLNSLQLSDSDSEAEVLV